MKNKIITISLLLVGLSSCKFFGGREVETEKGSKEIVTIIKNNLPKETSVSEISLQSDRDLSTHISMIDVRESGDKATVTKHTMFLMNGDKDEKEEIENTKKGNIGIKVEDISDNFFSATIQKMIALLPAEMEFASVNNYTQVFVNAKPGKGFVTIYAVPKKGENTDVKNGKIETTYEKFEFAIDENGNTKLLK